MPASTTAPLPRSRRRLGPHILPVEKPAASVAKPPRSRPAATIMEILLGSKGKAEVFRVLFGLDAIELPLVEIVERAGMAEQGIDEQLRRLASVQLVLTRLDRSRRLYRANTEHPLYPCLRDLVLKTSGLSDVVARCLAGAGGITLAFIFGSIARQEERGGSDVDLMIFGAETHRSMASRIAPLSAQLGREVNPHFFNEEELARRIRTNDHFLSRVLSAQKLFVIGDEATLTSLIEKARAG